MIQAVLVLTDGRVLSSRDPRREWRDTGIVIKELRNGTAQVWAAEVDAFEVCRGISTQETDSIP